MYICCGLPHDQFMAGSRKFLLHEFIDMGISGLASLDLNQFVSKIDTAKENGVRITKVKGALTFKDKTTTIGPLLVGAAVGSWNATEIEEAIEADPQSHEDGPTTEKAHRAVWPLWVIPASVETASQHIVPMEELYWPFKEIDEGEQVSFWIYNMDTASLTAMTAILALVWFGEWLRD